MGRMTLLVEGPDDSNTVFHLLQRYGLPIAERGRPFPDRLTIEDGHGIERILESLPLRIQTMVGEEPRPRLGLVLDGAYRLVQDLIANIQHLQEITYP